MASPIIDFLLTRNSAPIHELKEPAPSDDEIATMMRLASRVPDHGRLEPWRFILYRGEARVEIGRKLAELVEKREGPLPENRRKQELARFSRAPLVIGVVSSPKDNPKIPQWEMFLSGGMAAMNLMIAANALGYGANMISNWYSDVPRAGRCLAWRRRNASSASSISAPTRGRRRNGRGPIRQSSMPIIRGRGTADWCASRGEPVHGGLPDAFGRFDVSVDALAMHT